MSPGRVRIPTAGQAASFDRFAIRERGVPEPALMENAGRQAALIIQHLFGRGPVVALVGSGNNGGDALVCLRALAAWGRPVTAVTLGKRPDPDSVLHGWDLPAVGLDSAGSDEDTLTRLLESAGVVVDGLLGTGIRGAPRAGYAAAIEAANRAGGVLVALDTPSGVDGTTGEVTGASIRASLTIAFGWPKLGTLLYPGRAHCGRIVAVEIGFPPGGAQDADDWAELATSGWAAQRLPHRPPVTHKNAVGTLAVVAGSAMPGAAVLAAVRASDAVAVGPGLGTGDEAARQLETVLAARNGRPVVVDADALTLLARGVHGGIPALKGTGAAVTPHPGEMSRLTGRTVAEIQADRVGTARAFAAAHGVVTLLKGAPSLVADPDGRLLVSSTEHTSALAVAGMGDVLTGAVGSFLAQGVDPGAACGLALHVTGQAVAQSGLGASLTPSDVVEGMRASTPAQPGTDLPFPFVTFDQASPR